MRATNNSDVKVMKAHTDMLEQKLIEITVKERMRRHRYNRRKNGENASFQLVNDPDFSFGELSSSVSSCISKLVDGARLERE